MKRKTAAGLSVSRRRAVAACMRDKAMEAADAGAAGASTEAAGRESGCQVASHSTVWSWREPANA
jgi:hypothetical protein